MQHIGDTIRKVRLAFKPTDGGPMGLTQAELCRRCGVATSTMYLIEAGKTTPSELTLHRIADALGTTAEAIEMGLGVPANGNGDAPAEETTHAADES